MTEKDLTIWEEWVNKNTAEEWWLQLGEELRQKALERYIELNRKNSEFWLDAMFRDAADHDEVNNNIDQSYFDILFIDGWDDLQ